MVLFIRISLGLCNLFYSIADEKLLTTSGVTNTSMIADTKSIPTAQKRSTATSNVIFSKYFVEMSWFMSATESIPPASPPTKYPPISGIPCIQNRRSVIVPAYVAAPMASPVVVPAMVNCAFAKLPIAVPSTDAFQVSMKSAPTP